ncbi:transposase (plasmid) [Rhizobium leguminosarum]
MRLIEAVPERLDGSPRQLRRFWSDEFKATAVEQACQPGVNVSAIARQIGILPSQLYRWRREFLGSDEPGQAAATVDPQTDPDPESLRSGPLRPAIGKARLSKHR